MQWTINLQRKRPKCGRLLQGPPTVRGRLRLKPAMRVALQEHTVVLLAELEQQITATRWEVGEWVLILSPRSLTCSDRARSPERSGWK